MNRKEAYLIDIFEDQDVALKLITEHDIHTCEYYESDSTNNLTTQLISSLTMWYFKHQVQKKLANVADLGTTLFSGELQKKYGESELNLKNICFQALELMNTTSITIHVFMRDGTETLYEKIIKNAPHLVIIYYRIKQGKLMYLIRANSKTHKHNLEKANTLNIKNRYLQQYYEDNSYTREQLLRDLKISTYPNDYIPCEIFKYSDLDKSIPQQHNISTVNYAVQNKAYETNFPVISPTRANYQVYPSIINAPKSRVVQNKSIIVPADEIFLQNPNPNPNTNINTNINVSSIPNRNISNLGQNSGSSYACAVCKQNHFHGQPLMQMDVHRSNGLEPHFAPYEELASYLNNMMSQNKRYTDVKCAMCGELYCIQGISVYFKELKKVEDYFSNQRAERVSNNMQIDPEPVSNMAGKTGTVKCVFSQQPFKYKSVDLICLCTSNHQSTIQALLDYIKEQKRQGVPNHEISCPICKVPIDFEKQFLLVHQDIRALLN